MGDITIVAATNRPGSLTLVVSELYREVLAAKGIKVHLIDLQALPSDLMISALYANKGKNEAFNAVAKKLDAAERLLWVVPQYNGSFPGILKTFIDGYASPHIFRGKKSALAGVSRGWQGGMMGLSHFSDILSYLGMSIYGDQPKFPGVSEPTREHFLAHPGYKERIVQQLEGFLQF